MKKYLFLAVAALGFAACAEKGLDKNGLEQNGELEQSYLAVSLLADDMTTRAATDAYDDGDPSERVVKSFHFFLFKEDGEPFDIDNSTNYKAVQINETENDFGASTPDEEGESSSSADGTPNVSDIKDKVLVFENYKGEYPSKIVAVLNWTPPTEATSYTLEALAGQISNLKNSSNAFVMSNAVYASESTDASAKKEAINATPLSPENIAKNEDDALKNPVKIYVERVAAKVTVSPTTENKYDTDKDINGKSIYAVIEGWDFYNEYDKSYLLKHIDPAWTTASVGFNWNDAPWYRSYWATSLNTPFVPAENKVSYNTLGNKVNKSNYCGENTNETNCTKVVIKAKLVDENDQPVEVATWYGNDYVGELALRTVVANTLASQLYYLDAGVYKSIDPEHLMVMEADETNPNTSAELKAYHVFFQLSSAGKAKDWFTYSTAEGFKSADDNAIDVILGGVEPALFYKSGQTYYYTDIIHAKNTSKDITGVVRNHVYKVNIHSVKGFGTPVYDGNTMFDPERPKDITTYVSAEVRVLAWRVVDFDYDLK